MPKPSLVRELWEARIEDLFRSYSEDYPNSKEPQYVNYDSRMIIIDLIKNYRSYTAVVSEENATKLAFHGLNIIKDKKNWFDAKKLEEALKSLAAALDLSLDKARNNIDDMTLTDLSQYVWNYVLSLRIFVVLVMNANEDQYSTLHGYFEKLDDNLKIIESVFDKLDPSIIATAEGDENRIAVQFLQANLERITSCFDSMGYFPKFFVGNIEKIDARIREKFGDWRAQYVTALVSPTAKNKRRASAGARSEHSQADLPSMAVNTSPVKPPREAGYQAHSEYAWNLMLLLCPNYFANFTDSEGRSIKPTASNTLLNWPMSDMTLPSSFDSFEHFIPSIFESLSFAIYALANDPQFPASLALAHKVVCELYYYGYLELLSVWARELILNQPVRLMGFLTGNEHKQNRYKLIRFLDLLRATFLASEFVVEKKMEQENSSDIQQNDSDNKDNIQKLHDQFSPVENVTPSQPVKGEIEATVIAADSHMGSLIFTCINFRFFIAMIVGGEAIEEEFCNSPEASLEEYAVGSISFSHLQTFIAMLAETQEAKCYKLQEVFPSILSQIRACYRLLSGAPEQAAVQSASATRKTSAKPVSPVRRASVQSKPSVLKASLKSVQPTIKSMQREGAVPPKKVRFSGKKAVTKDLGDRPVKEPVIRTPASLLRPHRFNNGGGSTPNSNHKLSSKR